MALGGATIGQNDSTYKRAQQRLRIRVAEPFKWGNGCLKLSVDRINRSKSPLFLPFNGLFIEPSDAEFPGDPAKGLSEGWRTAKPLTSPQGRWASAGWLFHELEIQGNAHTVDEHLAFVDERLIGDFIIGKLPRQGRGKNELDGFGAFLGTHTRSQRIDDGEIVFGDGVVVGNLVQEILQLRSEKEIERLGGALVNGRFLYVEAQVVAQGHLESELFADNHESRRVVIHKLKFDLPFL